MEDRRHPRWLVDKMADFGKGEKGTSAKEWGQDPSGRGKQHYCTVAPTNFDILKSLWNLPTILWAMHYVLVFKLKPIIISLIHLEKNVYMENT